MVGDPLGKTWIPYAGFRVTGRKCLGKDCCGNLISRLTYKVRVIGSIVAWNKWTDPMNINCASQALIETSRTLYTMNGNRGYFLETEGQAFMPLSSALDAYIWGLGSWLDITGRGTIDATIVPGNVSPADDPFTDIFGARAGSGSTDNAGFNRSYYAVGLGLRVAL